MFVDTRDGEQSNVVISFARRRHGNIVEEDYAIVGEKPGSVYLDMCRLCDKTIIKTNNHYTTLLGFSYQTGPLFDFSSLFSDLFHYKSHGSVSNTAMWNVDAIRGTLGRQWISNQLANLHCSIQPTYRLQCFSFI